MRVTLKNMLTANGYEVVGEAGNGQDAVEKYAACRPERFRPRPSSFR